MKKIISLSVTLCMLLSLIGCQLVPNVGNLLNGKNNNNSSKRNIEKHKGKTKIETATRTKERDENPNATENIKGQLRNKLNETASQNQHSQKKD